MLAHLVRAALRYTKNATSLGINSESIYDRVAEKWSVPINSFVAPVVPFGKRHVQFELGFPVGAGHQRDRLASSLYTNERMARMQASIIEAIRQADPDTARRMLKNLHERQERYGLSGGE
jgi:hypothetical protein